MREAVFGGDLFWSNLPYEVLNFYEDRCALGNDVDLILFENDFRINKKFSGHEMFYFDVDKFKSCKNIKTVESWDKFYKLTGDYSKIFCSSKIAPHKPKSRYPYDYRSRSRCETVVWDVGGVDLLADSHIFADKWMVKGSVWKDFILSSKDTFLDAKDSDVKTGKCPLYERYYRRDIVHGKLASKEEFFKKYDLEKDKKVMLISPSNPGSHLEQFSQNQKILHKIIEMCHKKDYQCIVKTYPHDYIFYEEELPLCGLYKRKNPILPTVSQYDYMRREYGSAVKIVESQDHHESVLYSDIMFNMSGSSIAWETFYSQCKSFALNFSDKPYFKTLKYLPGLILPDDIFNFEPEKLEEIFTFSRNESLIQESSGYFH